MVSLVRVATCNLNQWAMDFDTNLANICTSIQEAKKSGAKFRTGPELEITGYGCQDHFFETDIYLHSWESIAAILKSDLTDGILCDIGLPILHQNVRYNCRIFLLDRKIIFIRPKLYLCDDGNYRESRWFTPWARQFELQTHFLPSDIVLITGQRSVPIGIAILDCSDCSVATETCEELFTPNSPHIGLGLCGAEIIANGSGSHHTLRKLRVRLDLIKGAASKSGGVYLYANQQGCDGDRLYYDGCANICVNGDFVAQGSQFSLRDVEVVCATVDLEEVRSMRGAIPSRSAQASRFPQYPRLTVDFNLVAEGKQATVIEMKEITPEEEIAYGPACWLWDYLRRSGGAGYFLPLSGGADSAATAAIVGSMCQLVVKAVHEGDKQVLADARRLAGGDANYTPTHPKEFASRVFHSAYMGTKNSSAATRARAKQLAGEIGGYHIDFDIDSVSESILAVFQTIFGRRPQFKVHGGSNAENLALQNIQARLRMVFSYLCAQLLPWARGKQGFLLVLGSANVDEALRGYMTKYDCSSADVNPIGGISKEDLRGFLRWASRPSALNYPSLADVVAAPPTAELEPITDKYTQTDEEDMGMTYAELGVFGRLRKLARCGPVTMYEKLRSIWSHLSPAEVGEKVKRFFFYYSINRHKMTTLTPSYHAENYSPDDNRYDLRQFLYNPKWTRQFAAIDKRVAESASTRSAARL